MLGNYKLWQFINNQVFHKLQSAQHLLLVVSLHSSGKAYVNSHNSDRWVSS